MGFVPRFHFWQNRQEKSLWRYFRKKKSLYSLQKQGVNKNRTIAVLKKGSSMVSVKKWDFFHVFIVGKIGKEKVSVDILEKKNAFLDSTTKE